MPAEVDVYREWLGITETARPLNHYQLLRLKQFEDDSSKIRETYRKMNAHVRKYSSGDFASRSQALLNELAKAMLCLTDARRKSEYDASLGRKAPEGDGRRRTMEEILLGRRVIDTTQLERARKFADTIGVELRDALVQQKMAASDVVMQAYAESVGLPYLDLNDITLDETLVPKVPTYIARQHSCVPVMVDDGQVLVASPHLIQPDVEEELRLRLGLPIRTVLCTVGGVNERIAKHYPREAAVAEMAAKGAAASSGKSTAAATTAPAKPQMTREEGLKRQKNGAVLAFNFAMIAAVGAQYFLSRVFNAGPAIFYALAVAVPVAGVTFLWLKPPKY